MHSTRNRLGPAAFFAAAALLPTTGHAATFVYADNTVFDDQDNVAGSDDLFGGTYQIVVGNRGVVSTISEFANGQIVTYSAPGSGTQLVARVDSGGSGGYVYGKFAELSLTQAGGDKLTFLANDQNEGAGLFQTTLDGSTLTPSAIQYSADYTLQTDSTSTDGLTSIHYTVNAAGQVAYQRRKTDSSEQQIVRSGLGSFTISTGDSSLTNFNNTARDNLYMYKRVQVAADGSIVFRATDTNTEQVGIYRSTSGSISAPIATVSSSSLIVSASNDRVLYIDANSSDTVSLNLTGLQQPLATFGSIGSVPHNAVMTQQNRVAFFDPTGGGPNLASLGYYPGSGSKTATVATDHENFTFDNQRYGIAALSSVGGRSTNPMVNDHGIVVFDASLTPEDADDNAIGDVGSVSALLAWRESSPNDLQIIVRASSDAAYADIYTDAANVQHQITLLLLDGTTDAAGDVTKDGLSDDDWVAFGIDYDNDAGYAVLSEQLTVPEPTSAAIFATAAAGALLRRRRRSQGRC